MTIDHFQPSARTAALLLALMAIAGGCTSRIAPARSAARSLERAPRAHAEAGAAASVQAMPAYAQARAACARGRYRQAATILATLADSALLSADQRAFCRTQQQICLSHLNQAAGKSTGPAARSRVAAFRSGPADCGPRALLLACQALGTPASLAALSAAAGTGAHGTSLAGLKRAAEGLGLRAEGVQASREALPDLPMPAVAWSHGDHFVAVLALKGRGERGTAVVHDPNETFTRTVSQERLLQACSGYLLTLRR